MPVLNDADIKISFNCNRLEEQVDKLTNAIKTGGNGAPITDVNLSLGDISVTYNTTDGVHMTSTGEITYEGKENKDQPVIDLAIPIVAGDGISIDKKENSEQIEIKAVGGASQTHLWLHSISLVQSNRTIHFQIYLPTDTKFASYAAFRTWMLDNVYLVNPGTGGTICHTDRTMNIPCFTSYTISNFTDIIYSITIGLSGGNAAENWGMWYESKKLIAPSGGGAVTEQYNSGVKIYGSATFTDYVVPIL